MKGHFHTLDGGGISEDKRMINAKSPWTLAHLDMKVLKGFYKNPSVPPSMKKKLKDAMMMKPSLKGGMCGRRRTTAVEPESPIQAEIDDLIRQWRAIYEMGNDTPNSVLLRIARVATRSRNGEESIRLLNRYPDINRAFVRYPTFRDDIYDYFRSDSVGRVPTEDPLIDSDTEVSHHTEDPDDGAGVGLTGGLAGVSKASGFIQRLMAENKLKHNGKYKKPTAPAHPDSTMNRFVQFDYKQIANKDQGGVSEANNSKYGASPFIQKYFKNGTVPFTKGHTAKETAAQKEQRKAMETRRRPAPAPVEEPPAPPAPAPEPAPQELREHFGNQPTSTKETKVMNGSSHYKLMKPRYFTDGVCRTGIEGLGESRKWLEKLMEDNLYVAQFSLAPSYKMFIEGTHDRGYSDKGVLFIPNFDKYTIALANSIPAFKMNKIMPSFYVKFLSDLKQRLIAWIKTWEDSYDTLVLPVLEQVWGSKKQHPLSMKELVAPSIKYPSEESKQFWKETNSLDIRIVGSITLQTVLFDLDWSKDFKKRSRKNQEDGLDSIESLLKVMEGLDTKEKRKARNEAILGWIDFHIKWRKEYLKTGVYPEGLEIPYTPDEVGWVLRNPDWWDLAYGDYNKFPPYTDN